MNINNEVLCGDVIGILNSIPNNTFDLIVTDPPYLMDYKTNHRKNKGHRFASAIDGDSDEKLIADYITLCYDKLKNNSAIYMFCNSNKIDYFKQEIEKYFTIKNVVVWVKNNWTAGDLKAQYGKQYEFIIYANKGRREINGSRISDVWYFDRVVGKNQLHQNQKPLNLIMQMIEKSSNVGDLVFDGFCGSGTTAVAAKLLKRDYFVCDINEEYVRLTNQRLGNTVQERQLLDNDTLFEYL